ncbi:MAG: GNAT family N-acetyltransferase [Candidatus Thorarchaeota archaeon]|nr:GNAT family N-acetyltransferase [Candidatus Thorarchaeota archaeon]
MRSVKHHIRSLKESDRADVMEIARLTWDGHDHLPHMFDAWLMDSNCFPYAIEVSNKVITLGNVKLIENGRTAWLEGLRVHPDFREQGFAHIMTNRMLNIAKEIGAIRTRLTLALENPAPSALAKSIGMYPVFSLAVGWKNWLKEIELKHDLIHVKQVTGTEMLDAINSNESILPSGIFVYHWYALDANLENVKSLDENITFWILKHEKMTVGLAIGLLRHTTDGPEWCTTIYAASRDAFKTMLTHQIKITKDQNVEGIMFQYSKEYEIHVKEIIGETTHEITLMLYEGPV